MVPVPLTLTAASKLELSVIVSEPPDIVTSEEVVRLRIVRVLEAKVMPVNPAPICASSTLPGRTSPTQFAAVFQSVPVAVSPPSQAIADSMKRASSRSS